MKLQFIGAAQTVTGSMHLLEVNGKKILLDCGLFQGKRKEAFELNRRFDFINPKEIDYLILSHAHIDHCGNIPNLVKRGFRGSIFSTHATKDLAVLLLQDSAHIQEHDTEFVNKKRKKQGKNLFEPLYTLADVIEAGKLFVGVSYHQKITVTDGVDLIFYDAGHILGSAVVYLTITENGKKTVLGFSGDLGRPNMPIIKDPEPIPDVDYFLCESTYGGRFHDDYSLTESKMSDVLKHAYENKSKIVIPAFSVGRTQELIYTLHQIFENGLAPRMPVYIDSPLSTNATDIFKLHPECFDTETMDIIHAHKNPFGFSALHFVHSVEESKHLNDEKGPCIIISASGMAETGRILHHLANNIENPKNIVMIVGYCAEHTLGRRIVEHASELRIFGDIFKLKAEVVVFNSLSAHADGNELLSYANNFSKERLKRIFLVHGDFDQQVKFKNRLLENGFSDIVIPAKGDVFEI